MAVLYVPADYATISEAMLFALPSDTIIVDSSYSGKEQVTIDVSPINLSIPAGVDDISLVLGDRVPVTLYLYGGGDVTIEGLGGENRIHVFDGDNWIEAGPGADAVFGGTGDDTVFGGTGADTIEGGTGDDVLDGDAGNDMIDGQGGHDSIRSGSGRDTVLGGWGDDTIWGSASGDDFMGGEVYDAGGGDDDWLRLAGYTAAHVVDLAAGTVTFDGGTPGQFTVLNVEHYDGTFSGMETPGTLVPQIEIFGNDADNELIGGIGLESISGGLGNDTLRGGGGRDRLFDGGGDDLVMGEGGDDTLHASFQPSNLFGTDFETAGTDTFDGGDGTDWLYVAHGDHSPGTVYELQRTIRLDVGTYAGNTILNIENVRVGRDFDVIGDAQDNHLQASDLYNGFENYFDGGGGDDTLETSLGDDTLYGGWGDDSLLGQAGDDTLHGGAAWTGGADEPGNDTLIGGAGADHVYAGAGDDQVIDGEGIAPGGVETDEYYGGDGIDTIVYTAASGPNEHIWLLANYQYVNGVAYDWIFGFENATVQSAAQVSGTNGANVIRGEGQFDNLFLGDHGNDTIYGGMGNDTVRGQGNDDTVIDTGPADGADDKDVYEGGAGIDTLVYQQAQRWGSFFSLSRTAPEGTRNGDTYTGFENLTVAGGVTLEGDDQSNVLTGEGWFDQTFLTTAGFDTLLGQQGDDRFELDLRIIDDNGISGTTPTQVHIDGGVGEDTLVMGFAMPQGVGVVRRMTIDLDAVFVQAEIEDLASRGGSGNTWIDPDFIDLRDVEHVTYTVAVDIDGTADANLLQARAGIVGVDSIRGYGGDDSIATGAGDDRLRGDAGDDSLDGGAGFDTAVYAGVRDDYVISVHDDVTYVRAVASDEGVDVLTGIEQLDFDDGTRALAPMGRAVAEFHSLGIGSSGTTLTLDNMFLDPVAVAYVATRTGPAPVAVRLDVVSGNQIDLALQEPDNEDGWHGNETVTVMVAEAGRWELTDGSILEAGRLDSDRLTSDGFEQVDFDGGFDAAPVFLSHVQSDNDGAFVVTRAQEVTATGAQLALQEEQATNGGSHGVETLGWIALEAGQGRVDGPVGNLVWHAATETGIGNAIETVSASGLYNFDVVASMSSYRGADPAWARGAGTASSSHDIFAQEDTSADPETTHVAEDMGIVAFAGGHGTITGMATRAIGEFGRAEVTSSGVTLDLRASYDAPVVIAHVDTTNGAQPVAVRVTDRQADSITLRLQEPDHLDGWHGAESVNYLVVDAGNWTLVGGESLQAGLLDSDTLVPDGMDQVAFHTPLDDAAVFSQVQTNNDDAFVFTRQDLPDSAGFALAMQEEEQATYGSHGTETLGWVAMEQERIQQGETEFQARRVYHNEDGPMTYGYPGTWETDGDWQAETIATLGSALGADPAWMRGADSGAPGADSLVALLEDTSADSETGHVNEWVHTFQFNAPGVIWAVDEWMG